MACSKCTSNCTCRLRVTDTNTIDLTLAGSGSRAAPWVVSGVALIDNRDPDGPYAQGSPQADASDAANFLREITGDDGGLTVYPSLDDNNLVGVGSDGGIYLPFVDSACIDLTGTGTEADPYSFEPKIAADGVCGDGGTNFLTCVETGDPATEGLCVPLSGDVGNIVQQGSDGGIYATADDTELVQGCGIIINGTIVSANVIGDFAADFPDCPDPINNGTALYCGDDGVLRGPPEHMPYIGFENSGQPAQYEAAGTVLGPGEHCGGAHTHTLTNPSDCRPMRLHVQFGLGTQQIIGAPGQPADVVWGYKRQLPTDAALTPFIEVHRDTARPGDVINHDYERDFFNIMLQPGESLDFTVENCLVNNGPGDVIVGAGWARGSIRWWGGTA